jgi:IS5 family transposase
MNRVVPWSKLVALVLPHAPQGKRGRPFPVETMLRIHFMQQWFTLSDPAMEEALHDVPLFREFTALDNWNMRLPDESTILRFRHLLEKHELAAQILAVVNAVLSSKGLLLKAGTVVDATLIAAQMQTIVNLVAAGLGVAWVPKSLCAFQRSGVSYHELDMGTSAACEMSLVWNQRRAPPVLGPFIRFASQ